MDLLKMFRRREKKQINKPVKDANNLQSIQHHKTRVENLSNEFEQLSDELKVLELDTERPRSTRNKEVDKVIFRMAIIKYEIDIREGLLKWLC